MTFDFERMSASKRAYRRRLAQEPIAEKLRMLDMLRQRMLALRANSSAPLVREDPASYQAKKE
jgi:hypothetical protein